MFVATFFQGLVKLFEQFALVLGELDRCFHRDVAIQITWEAGAQALDALVPGSPLPVLRMRMPSSMPAGILTSSVFCDLILPWP